MTDKLQKRAEEGSSQGKGWKSSLAAVEVSLLLDDFPEKARSKAEDAVAKFFQAREKIEKDHRTIAESLYTAGEFGEDGEGIHPLWKDLEQGLRRALSDDRNGSFSQLCERIRFLLLEDSANRVAELYRERIGELLEKMKSTTFGDGRGQSEPIERRLVAIKRMQRAFEVLEAPRDSSGRGEFARWALGESVNEECETVYRLYIDSGALFTIIKSHLEEGKEFDTMDWKFSFGGDVQNPLIERFLEEEGFTLDDVRLRTQDVIDHFVAGKKSLSVRAVKERFKEGKIRHVERIKAGLKEKYGQYMQNKEIDEKAAADEEELRNAAMGRRFRTILSHSTKKDGR